MFMDKVNACIMVGVSLDIFESKHMIVPRYFKCLPALVVYLGYLETISAKNYLEFS